MELQEDLKVQTCMEQACDAMVREIELKMITIMFGLLSNGKML